MMKNNRRRFLVGSGSVLAMTALPLSAGARATLADIAGQVEGIVAYREADKRSLAYASVLGEAGMTLLPLASDPVRQWRDQVREALVADHLPMYGLTDWSDYLLMKDLNAELRRFPVSEDKLVQKDTRDTEWAATLALSKLHGLNATGDVNNTPFYETDQIGNLFAWEIR